MITQRPLPTVFNEIYESCKIKKQDMAAYALFLASICSNNNRRCSYIPEGYVQTEGFEDYPLTVSGPCFKLVSLLAGTERTDNIRLSASGFRKISVSVTERYLDSSDINKDILYPEDHKVADYDRLLNKIMSIDLRSVYKSLTKNISEKELRTLIDDSYSDLTWRITAYTDNENVRKKKESKNTISNFAFSLAPDKCNQVIKELNRKYNNASDSEKTKLERILLPVYSISPYFSICISHKNRLPERIKDTIDDNICFVFILSFTTYNIKEEENTKRYSRTHNVFSYSELNKAFEKNSRIHILAESYGTSEKDQSLDREYYMSPSYGYEKCCAADYKTMRSKYDHVLDKWENYFVKYSCQWIPIDASESQELLELLSDTGLFRKRYEKKINRISVKGITRRKAIKMNEDADKTARILTGEEEK